MGQRVDLFIPAAPKDYNKVTYAIEQAERYVEGIAAAYVVTPTGARFHPCVMFPTYYYRDDEVLHVDLTQIRHRPNWVYQQFLKLFQTLTRDLFLVIDADLLFNRKVSLFKDGKPVFLLGRDQYSQPYFTFNEKMLGFGKVYPWSFLSECTLYDRTLIHAMIAHCGCEGAVGFIEKSFGVIDGGCYPAESELYGSYVHKMHPGHYEYAHLQSLLNGRYGGETYTDQEIRDVISEHAGDPTIDIISIHSWEGG